MSTSKKQFTFSSSTDTTNRFSLSTSSTAGYHAQPKYDDGEVTVTLTDEDIQRVRDLAEQRAESYVNGRTRDERSGGHHTTTSVHVQGLRAELAVAKAFGDGWDDVDKSISDNGDDGTDITLRLDGEEMGVDVKSSSYWYPAIMVKAHKKTFADAYMMVYDEDFRNSNELIITGWAPKEEVIDESNLRQARGGDWMNYDYSDYRDCPKPQTTERLK